MTKLKKLLFVGGHHTSALPVINELKKQTGPFEYQFFWVGHRHSMWGDKSDSLEYRDVAARQIPFYDLKAGKLYHTFHPLKLVRIPWGFIQAVYFLLKIRPHLVISFGGYLSVPVDIVAWVFGIPVITHEQTVVAGFANRLVAHFAKEVLLTWPQSLSKFPKGRAKVVGLPLRQELLSLVSDLPPISNPSLIYVAGGKQGSHVLNEALYGVLPRLLAKYRLVHQCGSSSVFNDYTRLQDLKKTMPQELSQNYVVSDFFEAKVVAELLRDSSLIVTRSGAHIVYELLAYGKPCLLIPLPGSSHNEQYLNAKILEEAGIGKILPEAELTHKVLEETIDQMLQDLPKYQQNAERARTQVSYDSAKKIAEEITALLAE